MPPSVPVAPAAPVTPQAVKPTTPAAPSQPAAPAAEPTFEVTVDGKPVKLTRRQIERYAGKGAYADQLIEQGKKAINTTKAENERREALKKRLKEDRSARDEWMREHGLDPDEYARERLTEKLAESEMTEEQRENARLKKDIADRDAKLKEVDDEKAKTRLTENAKRIQARIENELGAAWERAGFTQGDAESFFAVYEAMSEFHGLGLLNPEAFTAADADRICEAARENIDGAYKRLESQVTKGLKGKALYDRLGKSVVDELNRYQVELIRGGGMQKSDRMVKLVSDKPAAKSEDYMTLDQARAKVREMGK